VGDTGAAPRAGGPHQKRSLTGAQKQTPREDSQKRAVDAPERESLKIVSSLRATPGAFSATWVPRIQARSSLAANRPS